MEVNALQQMLSRMKQVQEDLQRQVNAVAVEASAGGGMVVVRMNGQKQLVDVRIEPDVFASKDQEMLQDLIRAAVNEAARRVDDELSSQMKNLSGTIPGIPGLKIPGFSPSVTSNASESSTALDSQSNAPRNLSALCVSALSLSFFSRSKFAPIPSLCYSSFI